MNSSNMLDYNGPWKLETMSDVGRQSTKYLLVLVVWPPPSAIEMQTRFQRRLSSSGPLLDLRPLN